MKNFFSLKRDSGSLSETFVEYKYSVNQKVKTSWDFGEEYRLAAEL